MLKVTPGILHFTLECRKGTWTLLKFCCVTMLMCTLEVRMQSGNSWCLTSINSDKHGQNTLHIAVWHGWLNIVKLLLKYNADVDARNHWGETPLHLAASLGHLDIVGLLLKHNADVNARDQWGETPLHQTACVGHLDVVQFLFNHNADVHARNNKGKTPLDGARGCMHAKKVVYFLLGHMNGSRW
ncbi:hypothetical protein H2248_002437 [Termitomyces sp. 'cryptogamus']|nr:hypothetical protein H2248_002437 [Termitomyces sp. 'cryptogamus']